MAFSDILVGMVLAGFGAGFIYTGQLGFRILRHRRDVILQLTLKEDRDVLKLVRPREDGQLKTEWGVFWALPGTSVMGSMGIHKNKRKFRFKEGNPFPYKYGEKIVREIPEAANGGFPSVKYERFDEPQVLHPKAVKTYFDQHDFRDAYSGKQGLMLLVVVGIIILILLVIGLYATIRR